MKLLFEFALVAAFAQTAPAQQPSLATLAGTVVVSGSNEPIPDAGVQLTPIVKAPAVAPPGPPSPFPTSAKIYTAATTEDGKFLLSDIPAGDYRLAATHVGYVRAEYGQNGPNRLGATITISAGQKMADMRVPLMPTGAISGRIFDRNGSPFPNVQVQALKYVYEDGRRVLSTVKAMVTDDQGEYRLFWLQPGDYLVMAKPLRGAVPDTLMMPSPSGGLGTRPIESPTGAPIFSSDDAASVPFYFPGKLTPQSGSVIHVKPGDDLQGMNIAIQAMPARRVRGFVTNLPSNLPPSLEDGGTVFSQVRVRLSPRTIPEFDRDSDPIGPGTSVNRKTGAFEIPGVTPGSYYLFASLSVSGNAALYLHARIPVEVGNDDLKDIAIQLEPDFDVPVHTTIAGRPENSVAPELAGLRVRLNSGNAAQRAPQQPAGSFVFRQLRPVDDRITVDQLPEGGYVQSIRMGATNILTDGFHIDRPSSDAIEIVIGLNAGSVNGTVATDSTKPIENTTVALVPSTSDRRDLYKTATTDAAGRFSLTGIAPGDYLLFAWSDVPNGAWQDPEFIKQYEDRGKPLHIEEGSAVNMQLTAN